MKRIPLVVLVALLGCFLVGFTIGGSAQPSDADPVQNEPKYVGETAGGKPTFDISWSEVEGADSYVVAIYAELDNGLTDRQELDVYDALDRNTIFLQGVYTDTVTYRIKVKALFRATGKAGQSSAEQSRTSAWSEVWQIAFVDGEYTVTGDVADFDEELAAIGSDVASGVASDAGSSASGVAGGSGEASDAGGSAAHTATLEPVEHDLPESLLEFVAKEYRVDKVDLSDAAFLMVNVNRCLYGEPTQYITDEKVIAAAAKAAEGITVTGDPDGMMSTGTSTVYAFLDGEGDVLADFAFQDGMLVGDEGRYPVSGLDVLTEIDGIMQEGDWDEYWTDYSSKADDYEYSFSPKYPESVFAMSGYSANMLAEIDPDDIGSIMIHVDWNDDAGKLQSSDPAVIASVYKALASMRVTGEANEEPVGQDWYVHISYGAGDDFYHTAYLHFHGDYLVCDLGGRGDQAYEVDGLEALFDAADSDVLSYLKEMRTTRLPDPVY